MGQLNLQAHEWVRDPKTGQMVIGKENPCINIGMQHQPNIYLQNGEAYFANGRLVSPLPTWAVELIRQIDKPALKRVGWMDHPLIACPSTSSVEVSAPASDPPSESIAVDQTAAAPSEAAPLTEAEINGMKWFALKAWARKEHGISGETRDEIIQQLVIFGILKG